MHQAFSTLTGYPVDEVIGTNCRFLQSDKTEPLALYNLITAIRTYTRVTVKISNAKKDGTHFVNDLSTHPIFDSDGKCRFMVCNQRCLVTHSACILLPACACIQCTS